MVSLTPLKGRTPSGVRKSSLLGPTGQPLSYFLYPSPRHNARSYKPRPWLSNDTKLNISSYDRMELVNYSRQLRAQIDLLDTAITQKNSWAFGDAWDAHYTGQDKSWGKVAGDWLNNVWMPNCNVRGPLYDFKTSMNLSGMAWDTDGDDVMVLTESPTGFPMLAFYPATKIASYALGIRPIGTGPTVDGGPFDGAKIIDGIILDRNNRPIALRIIGDDGDSQDISAYNADLAYEPAWCDQARGIPRIAVSLLKWMNLQDIDEFIQRGVKRAMSVGLIQKTEEGEGAVGNEILTEEEDTQLPPGQETDRKITYEEIEGGEMYYLSSTGGESIEGLTYKNPHPNTEAYIERVQRGALTSVGWFAELLDLTSTGRAPARILCELANQSIWARQKTAYRRWRRGVTWAIGKGMKTGQIPKNNNGFDPYLWSPGLPKPLTVDAGNDLQSDRDGIKLGVSTKAIYAQKHHGIHYREMDDQREMELRETITRAEGINRDHPQVPFDRALELLEQRSPNPIAQMTQTSKTTTTKTTGA